jgi:hypothetical protein
MYAELKELQKFNTQVRKSQATKFCMVVCNICGSSVWLLSPFAHLESQGVS